jgi:hypothetical protein
MMLTNVMPRNGLPSEEVLRAALDQSGYAMIHSLVASRKSVAVRAARSESYFTTRSETMGLVSAQDRYSCSSH